MTSTPWVLLISGSSSSGKTTLARTLLSFLEEPSVLLEADRLLPPVSTWHDGLDPIATIDTTRGESRTHAWLAGDAIARATGAMGSS